MSTRGISLDEVGFIHASRPSQLRRVAAAVYRDCPEPLVILVLDDDDLERAGISVRYEDGGSGEEFPHIYGPIPPDLVLEVRLARMNSDVLTPQ